MAYAYVKVILDGVEVRKTGGNNKEIRELYRSLIARCRKPKKNQNCNVEIIMKKTRGWAMQSFVGVYP